MSSGGAPLRRLRSRRGRCLTSWPGSSSPSRCTAPGRSYAASRITSERRRGRTVSEAIVRTEPLGGSALSQAARTGQLPQWYRPSPRGANEWIGYGREVAESASATWFRDLDRAIAPTGRAGARLARAVEGRGVVVTTGQQPGLFGGPLMTLVKAITARALADALQATLGLPVAPLFWAATDDADFHEAAVVS